MKSKPQGAGELESEPFVCIVALKISPLLLSDGLFFIIQEKKKAYGTNNDPLESLGNYLQ